LHQENTDTGGYVTNETLLTPFTLTNSAGVVINNAVLVKLTRTNLFTKPARVRWDAPAGSLPEDFTGKIRL